MNTRQRLPIVFSPATHRRVVRELLAGILVYVFGGLAPAAAAPSPESVISPNALFQHTVGNLEQHQAVSERVSVEGQAFSEALRITFPGEAPRLRSNIIEGDHSIHSGAVYLLMPSSVPVRQGDVLRATLSLRGTADAGRVPASIRAHFELTRAPWTKSTMQTLVAAVKPDEWKKFSFVFRSVADYDAGEVGLLLNLANDRQTVEIGGVDVVNHGADFPVEHALDLAAEQNPLGATRVVVDLTDRRQTLTGMGGNFAGPRFGDIEPMDAAGRYNLEHLPFYHARVALPLHFWNPAPNVYKHEAQSFAALQQMQIMAKRGLPLTMAIWVAPEWMTGAGPRQPGVTIPREHYEACVDAIAEFLVLARDRYDAHADYLCFNEPDRGNYVKFTPSQMAEFIRVAGPRFAERGLKTKFLVGDTLFGRGAVAYSRPLLQEPALAPYLGPIAFHCWDVLMVAESHYEAIAALGREFNKPIWVTEGGHDVELWREKPSPYASWNNALSLARAYLRTLRLSGAQQIDYWTLQDNYALVSKDGSKPFPAWHVLRELHVLLAPGAVVTSARPANNHLDAIAVIGAKPGDFAVLIANPVGAGEAVLEGLPPDTAVKVLENTADLREHAREAHTDSQGKLRLSLPARAFVTVRKSP